MDSTSIRMENSPTLTTQRLILRKFTPEDAPALHEILSDPVVNTFLPWFPTQTLEETRRFLEARYLKSYEAPSGYQYAICFKEDGRPIGYIGVNPSDAHDLGYGLSRAHWGKGIAAEAGRAVLERCRQAGYPFVTATHDVHNPRSGRVMQKLGMIYRYSYQEQWQPKDILVTFRMYQLNFDGNDDGVYREYWDSSKVRFVETLD